MTFAQEREWHYLVEERLGILCGTGQPTPEQVAMAEAEATAWVERNNSALATEAQAALSRRRSK